MTSRRSLSLARNSAAPVEPGNPFGACGGQKIERQLVDDVGHLVGAHIGSAQK